MNMIITKIRWWLWNQLFQYAIWRALSVKHQTTLFIDTSMLVRKSNSLTWRELILDKFNCTFTKVTFLNKILNSISGHRVIKEKSLIYDEEVKKSWKNISLEWYRQSERYFKNIRMILLEELEPQIEIDIYTKSILNLIKSKNSVAVHIRRWDYIQSKKNLEFHWVCSQKYYKDAVNHMLQKYRDLNFFIFSDEINWVYNNMNSIFPENNTTYVKTETDLSDFLLMKTCNNFIIANSTFSWWAAWLWTYENKLCICPKDRYSGLTPKQYSIIPTDWFKL